MQLLTVSGTIYGPPPPTMKVCSMPGYRTLNNLWKAVRLLGWRGMNCILETSSWASQIMGHQSPSALLLPDNHGKLVPGGVMRSD